MPRTSRSVAQRLASQGKLRKRRPRTTAAPNPLPTTDQVSDGATVSEAEASADATLTSALSAVEPSRTAAPPVSRSASPARRTGSSARTAAGRGAARPVVARRRYFEYATEYAYVSADLRRIALVAVVLIALLVALSFVIQ
jgi:hypothetical protein